MRKLRFALLLSLTISQVPLLRGADDPSTSDKDYKPLTVKQRTDYFLRETVAGPGIYMAALGSGIGQQLGNKPPEWGQGTKGYVHRFGSQFGLYAVSRGINNGGAAALGYDPRYIRSGRKGFPRRFTHALAWSFLTYDKERHIRFDAPVVAGAYGSGMISSLWFPGRFTPLRDGIRTGNVQMGVHVGVNIVKEFAPELKRIIGKK